MLLWSPTLDAKSASRMGRPHSGKTEEDSLPGMTNKKGKNKSESKEQEQEQEQQQQRVLRFAQDDNTSF